MKISILISIRTSIRTFLKISISIRAFLKISISIKYRIDKDLAYRTPLVSTINLDSMWGHKTEILVTNVE